MSHAQAVSAKAVEGKRPEARLGPSWHVWAGAAAFVVALAAGVVVYLANQRGEEIVRQRAEIAQRAAAGNLVQAFRESKGVLIMSDGSRQALEGATSLLLTTKPVAGEKATWLALGRTGSGVYFGRRFSQGPGGAVRPLTDAQEVSQEVALGELRAQIAASGAKADAAEVFIQAATSGKPAALGQ